MTDELDFPDLIFPDAFKRAAAVNGDQEAVIDGEDVITYSDLDTRSDRLASSLLGLRGSQPEVAAVACDRLGDYVTACVGVLKAGKTVLPLDPGMPDPFLRRLIDDAGADFGLTNMSHLRGVGPIAFEKIARHIDEGNPRDTAPYPEVASYFPAFLHYTSGTTGRPKPVCWPHRTCMYQALGVGNFLALQPGTRLGLMTPPTFAIATMQIALMLLSGGTILYYPAGQRGISELPFWVTENKVSFLFLVTTALRGVLALGSELPSLKYLVVTSEPVTYGDAARAYEVLGGRIEVTHAYGQSEAGWVAGHKVSRDEAEAEDQNAFIPAGVVLTGTDVLLDHQAGASLDDSGSGTSIGEIIVESRFLPPDEHLTGRELVNRTLEAGDPSVRRLRTGDAGEIDQRGLLVLRGRISRMVKVRGTRVDLATVEQSLLQRPGVREAAVVPIITPRGQTQLRAAVVPVSPSFELGDLKMSLRELLPEPMVPAQVMVMDAMPSLANGKADLQALIALPSPAPPSMGLRAPDLEIQLADLWSSVLETPVGPDDDFFELGGDSLSAVEVVLAVEDRLGFEIRGADLLSARTVRELAIRLTAKLPEASDRVPVRVTNPAYGGPRLFFVPSLGGNIVQLRPLADSLRGDVVVYGVSAWDREPAASTVSEEARALVDGVRQVQPDGPYWLGGHSAGGVVALEMARIIEREGGAVAGLLVLDTILGASYRPPDAPRPVLPSQRGKPVRERGSGYVRIVRNPMFAVESALVRLGLGDTVDRAVWEMDLRLRGRIRPYRRGRYLWKKELHATDTYAPGPCRAPITLLRSPDYPDHAVERTWKGLALNGFDVRYLDIPHHELVAARHTPVISREVLAAAPVIAAAHTD